MSVEVVHVEWVQNQVFLLRDHFDFPLVMAQPAGVNGADLLPLSIAGCAVWDIMSILQKQHQGITGMRVSAESVRERQNSPGASNASTCVISSADMTLTMR